MTSNAETVREAVDQFRRTREFDLDVIDPDIEWRTLVESYRGHEGLVSWQRELRQALGEFETEMLELREVADVVVTDMTLSGTAQTTGIEGEVRFGAIWRFRDGRLAVLDTYRTFEEALAAASASEEEKEEQ